METPKRRKLYSPFKDYRQMLRVKKVAEVKKTLFKKKMLKVYFVGVVTPQVKLCGI